MHKRGKTERGAAALEFALVMPLLLLLLFGIIGFGIVFAQNLALGNAARQAARFGVVEGNTCAQIKQMAVDEAISVGMDGPTEIDTADVTVTVNGVACSGTTQPCKSSAVGASVRVLVPFTSELLIPIAGFPDSVDIEGEGEFRCEFS
jgi:Flp pilus assembly protein TadG